MNRKVVVPHKEVIEIFAKTKTVREFAKVVGVSEETARRIVKEAGIKPKIGGTVKYNPDPESLEQQYQEMSLAQIAILSGVGETTVHAKVKELGIKYLGSDDNNGKRRKRPPKTDEQRMNMSLARVGKYRGDKGGNWQGGKAEENRLLRQSLAYKLWQKAALSLRGNVCQECGAVGGNVCECCGTVVKLHVHHIHSFAKYPDTRFDPNNSEVLCPKCHYSRHRCKSGELLETP